MTVVTEFGNTCRATDNNRSQTGPVQWTPWAGEGGGVSPWAFDSNAFDPDGYAVGIEVY